MGKAKEVVRLIADIWDANPLFSVTFRAADYCPWVVIEVEASSEAFEPHIFVEKRRMTVRGEGETMTRAINDLRSKLPAFYEAWTQQETGE